MMLCILSLSRGLVALLVFCGSSRFSCVLEWPPLDAKVKIREFYLRKILIIVLLLNQICVLSH